MKTISRYIMTLALLLTAVTGAWAQGPWTSGDCTVTFNNGTLTVSGNGAMADYTDPSNRPWDDNKGDITSVVVESGVTSVGTHAFAGFSNLTSVTLPEGLTAIGDMAFYGCSSLTSVTIPSTVTSIGAGAFYSCSAMTSVTLSEGLTAIGGMAFSGCSSLTSVTIPSTVTSIGDMAFFFCSAISDVNLYANPDNLTWADTGYDFKESKATQCHVLAEHLSTYQNKFSSANVTFVGDLEPLATGIEVTPGSSANTWTFTMPAFDVEIAPIYAPVAQWAKDENVDQLPTAIEGIYAESTDAIVKAGAVAKIGETEDLQGTLMYAVGTSATEQPALTAFSATLPTAKDITTAGDVYVWYYIKGADTPQGQTATAENTFNDSEICTTPLKVTVLNNKFDIQFKAANDNTIEASKATVTVGGTAATVTEGKLEGVKMGSEVKLKANNGYKFRKVEVKKKAAPRPLAEATAEDLGKVVCAAGHLHDAKTAVPAGCTAVGILGKVTGTGHGLILALQDATEQDWETINGWTSASYAGTTLKVLTDAARGTNLTSYTTLGSTSVSNWAVAQKSDYEAIFTNLGSTINGEGTTYDGNVNAYITTVGGTAISGGYWSATEREDPEFAWVFLNNCWDHNGFKTDSYDVRPVLGF